MRKGLQWSHAAPWVRMLLRARQAGMGEVRTTVGAGLKLQQGGGGIFKTAAVAVLRMERRLMATGEITKSALQKRGCRQQLCQLCTLACSMFHGSKAYLAPSTLSSIMQVAALLTISLIAISAALAFSHEALHALLRQ